MNTKDAASGHCYCESVTFKIRENTELLLNGYCHCSDCRRANACNLYHYVYLKEEDFEITGGEDLLSWYVKDADTSDSFRRYFCSKCGTRTHNFRIVDIGGKPERLIGTFPSLLGDLEVAKSEAWRPTEHIFTSESILNVNLFNDGLPRHPAMPTRGS